MFCKTIMFLMLKSLNVTLILQSQNVLSFSSEEAHTNRLVDLRYTAVKTIQQAAVLLCLSSRCLCLLWAFFV